MSAETFSATSHTFGNNKQYLTKRKSFLNLLLLFFCLLFSSRFCVQHRVLVWLQIKSNKQFHWNTHKRIHTHTNTQTKKKKQNINQNIIDARQHLHTKSYLLIASVTFNRLIRNTHTKQTNTHPHNIAIDSPVVSPKIAKLSSNIPVGAVRSKTTTSPSVADAKKYEQLFSKTTKAIVWGMQTRAVQSMLDFDFICR